MGVQSHALLGAVLCWALLWSPGGAQCPWEEEGLSNWSLPSTWEDGVVPPEGSKVVIPGGKRVLLDVQPAKLSTLTIEAGGALVWGPVDGLTLDTHYVWVKGEFHLGGQTCRFPYQAHIRLHGNPQDEYHVVEHEFKRKFFGVAPGGTLEIHGRRKTSWTKLAQTVRPISQMACAGVYDHNDFTQNLARTEKQVGLNVLAWNEDGSFMDYGIFKSPYDAELTSFVNGIPEGKIVAMMTFGSQGIDVKNEVLEAAVVSLGGTLISTMESLHSYVFVGKKGSSSTVQEKTSADTSDGEVIEFLTHYDEDAGLLFQVAVNSGTVKQLTMFRVLNADAAFPKLTLVDEVRGWSVGDEVFVTSTDFNHEQLEVRTIISCKDCTSRQIRVNAAFDYMHYGNFTNYVDERAEVAMLSRSIVIEGVLDDECHDVGAEEELCSKFGRDTFGGHLMVVRGFKDVHVRGAKLYHMGQQWNKGAYPLHFHMVDSAKGAYLRENTVHDSFSRCFTIHGTDYLEVKDNVCYEHLGHGLFLEDSVEQNNVITGNLIAGTRYGRLLMSDRNRDWCTDTMREYCDALSSYWLTHPNNEISGNVAAGGEGNGYMYAFADKPLGPSRLRQSELNRTHSPKTFPLHFTRNVGHSNKKAGVWMDEKISTGTGYENKGDDVEENGIFRTENEYDPQENGKPVWTEMSYGTFYKNCQINMWVKGGNIRVSYTTIGDSVEGFSGGTTLFNSGTEVYKCIFIGETENKGNPSKNDPLERSHGKSGTESLTAVGLYQGPNFVKNCYFDHYHTVQWCEDPDTSLDDCSSSKIFTRNAGAISFKRSNTYPTMTSTYAVSNTFGFCDNDEGQHWVWQGPNTLTDWEWEDGNRNVFLRDKDGHLTGTANTSIVPNFHLFSGDECQPKKDWGDMLACPYRYVKMEVLGGGGNLDKNLKDQYPLVMERDDYPYNVSFEHQGRIRNEWLLRTNRSYILNVNKTLPGAAFPDQYKIFGYGVEKGDVVRVGLCLPKDVKREDFDILMDYPVTIRKDPVWVDSLQELDDDTVGSAFYLDPSGILFFKMLSFHQDTNDTQQCPDGHCWYANIWVNGGTKTNLRTCRSRDIESYVGSLPVAEMPTTPDCPPPSTPEGLGSVDWNNVGHIELEEYSVPCKTFSSTAGRAEQVYMGCYLEKFGKDDQEMRSNEVLFLTQSMNIDYCTARCYHRGYQYAALSRGTRCTCGNVLTTGDDYFAADVECSLECRGDASQTCGGDGEIAVWTTGIPA